MSEGINQLSRHYVPGEAVDKAKAMPGDEVVVKSQVLAGGRGLGHFKENNFKPSKSNILQGCCYGSPTSTAQRAYSKRELYMRIPAIQSHGYIMHLC